MAEQQIVVSYDGGDARHHAIEARLFGQSLQGLDRMVSDCLVILTVERLPKRGERAPLLLKARAPEAGSVTVAQLLQQASDLLGIGVPILQAIGPEVVSYYVGAVLDHFRGKDEAVETAIRKMAEMHQIALQTIATVHRESIDAMRQVDAHRHAEVMGMQDLLRTAIRGSGPAAVDYVAPVGLDRSVDTATFVAGSAQPLLTTVDDAEAIRESQKVDWETPQNQVLVTDGFKFHTSALSVQNPEKADGFLMAEVNDPVFEEESNPYTVAAQKRAKIEVLARRGYKNGNLARIIILDFVREIHDHAA